MNVKDNRQHRIALQATFTAGLLLVWYAGHLWIPLLPTPTAVVGAFQTQLQNGALISALLQSLYAILLGFGIAVLVGIPLGFLMGISSTLELLLDPYVNALYVVPLAGLIPAMILWFGSGLEIRVVVVFLFAVFPILINTLEGAKTTPEEYVKIAKSFGASTPFIVRNVLLPHDVPYIVAGLRLGMGLAVRGLVVTELIVSVTGFGQIINEWGASLRMEGVLSVVIVLMSLGVVSTWLLNVAADLLVNWDTAEV